MRFMDSGEVLNPNVDFLLLLFPPEQHTSPVYIRREENQAGAAGSCPRLLWNTAFPRIPWVQSLKTADRPGVSVGEKLFQKKKKRTPSRRRTLETFCFRWFCFVNSCFLWTIEKMSSFITDSWRGIKGSVPDVKAGVLKVGASSSGSRRCLVSRNITFTWFTYCFWAVFFGHFNPRLKLSSVSIV